MKSIFLALMGMCGIVMVLVAGVYLGDEQRSIYIAIMFFWICVVSMGLYFIHSI